MLEDFEISVQQVAEDLRTDRPFHIIDVREEWEVAAVRLEDKRVSVLPMSRIAVELEAAYPGFLKDRQAEIVVMCHHGVRSANVTRWMLQNGWQNVKSMAGGIDAYAAQIDPSIGFY